MRKVDFWLGSLLTSGFRKGYFSRTLPALRIEPEHLSVHEGATKVLRL